MLILFCNEFSYLFQFISSASYLILLNTFIFLNKFEGVPAKNAKKLKSLFKFENTSFIKLGQVQTFYCLMIVIVPAASIMPCYHAPKQLINS